MATRHVLPKDQKPGGFVKGFFEHGDSRSEWVLRACLLDAHNSDCVYDATGGRWVVTCELHAAALNCQTKVAAEWFAYRPGSFCPHCAETEADWLLEDGRAYD